MLGLQSRFNFVVTSFADFNRNLIADMRAHAGKPTSGPFLGRDVLILTTRGAKSGDTRESPLVYTRDGDHYVIVASKGGAPTHPSWYHNLVKHPEVGVEVLGKKFDALAHIAGGDADGRDHVSRRARLVQEGAGAGFHRRHSRGVAVVT